MSKRKKTTTTGRMPERMQRHTQRAHTYTDRKKDASRKACRGKVAA